MDKRAIQKALYEAKKKLPIRITPEIRAGGEKLLQKAKEDYHKRQLASDKNIENYAWEAAGYVRNRVRGTVYFVGGIGKGKFLGSGKWRYRVREGWIKLTN